MRAIEIDTPIFQVPGMDQSLEAVRIAFVSDIHIDRFFTPSRARQLLELIQGQRPDLLLLGGDYAESSKDALWFAQSLKGLDLPLGGAAVLGNNDRERFLSAEEIETLKSAFLESGVRLLVNEEAGFPGEGARICVGGLDEAKHGCPDSENLFSDARPGDVRILLSHHPHSAAWLLGERPHSFAKLPHLILCGHTHGGQWRIGPFSPYTFGYDLKPAHGHPFPWRGLKAVEIQGGGGIPCLVSNGIGTSLLPLRIGAPPQIHLLSLKPARQ